MSHRGDTVIPPSRTRIATWARREANEVNEVVRRGGGGVPLFGERAHAPARGAAGGGRVHAIRRADDRRAVDRGGLHAERGRPARSQRPSRPLTGTCDRARGPIAADETSALRYALMSGE